MTGQPQDPKQACAEAETPASEPGPAKEKISNANDSPDQTSSGRSQAASGRNQVVSGRGRVVRPPFQIDIPARTYKTRDCLFWDRLFVPLSERQFMLTCKQSPEAFLAAMDAAAQPKLSLTDGMLSAPPFVIANKDNIFKLRRQTNPLTAILRPVLSGVVERQEDGTSKICLSSSLSGWAEGTVNAPLWSLIGAMAGFAISIYLFPHPMLLFYSLLGTLAVPTLLSILTILVVSPAMKTDIPYLLDQLYMVSDGTMPVAADAEEWAQMPRRPILSEGLIAGFVSSVLFLAIAYGMHALAWDFWVQGKYKESAALCEPVRALAEAALGQENVATSDCKYYLAECYRCLDRLPEAEKLYSDAITGMAKSLGESSNFYADAVFNLGRVYEGQGKLDRAEAQYTKALASWAKSQAIGPRNLVYAKGLNRLAAVQLKQGKYKDAYASQKRVLEIDQAYGDYAMVSVEQDLNDLAAIGLFLADVDKHENMLLTSLRRKSARLGSSDLSLTPTYIDLAKLLIDSDRSSQAQACITSAVDILGQCGYQPPAGRAPTLAELSKAYGERVKTVHANYEVPNMFSRADFTYRGDGYL